MMHFKLVIQLHDHYGINTLDSKLYRNVTNYLGSDKLKKTNKLITEQTRDPYAHSYYQPA